ncbi:hypothetical protein AAFF_G00229290 [Aldrovandia affinis]|uniref:Uncharacterized protein n=1 Tax=Aldrovandia affinis TaxID=143900 RepID=A0AAD7WUI4_9TELE|nr:hypothetical protein AAFF_G00229290 [Aldrovandia affinis]
MSPSSRTSSPGHSASVRGRVCWRKHRSSSRSPWSTSCSCGCSRTLRTPLAARVGRSRRGRGGGGGLRALDGPAAPRSHEGEDQVQESHREMDVRAGAHRQALHGEADFDPSAGSEEKHKGVPSSSEDGEGGCRLGWQEVQRENDACSLRGPAL